MNGAQPIRYASGQLQKWIFVEGMDGLKVFGSVRMKLRILLVFAVTIVFQVRSVAADVPPATAPGAKALPVDPLDSLKPGQSADAIKALLGEPGEIRPMDSPKGKAEVWVYLKEVSRRMDRIDVSTPDVVINVTESDGSVRQKITPGLVRFQDVHYLVEDVNEILLFNDQYVVHKVTRRERKL